MGRLRAVPVVPGDGAWASHLNPDAPHAIERWNGHTWELYGFASAWPRSKPSCTRRPMSPRSQCRCRSRSVPAPVSTTNPRRPGRRVTAGHRDDQRRRA
ncbi:DUF6087 family protein [Streptomyces sp. NPDC046942]|uniref:DUF6087 family protein n=1 Tax=Streptomyces sp. NPDC046942 TaxID=3155137 RepID=UPI0033E060A0